MIRKIFIAPIRFYQYAISPLFGPRCKYYPSCSEYTVQAIREHGPLKGIGLGAWRHPALQPLQPRRRRPRPAAACLTP